MAVNITLNIFDKSGENHLKRICLYFGKSLQGSWDGWKWAQEQGFTIDGPWAYDKGNERSLYKVTKSQITEWIKNLALSIDPLGRDQSVSFLDPFSDDAVFYLNFMDWS